MKLSIVSTLAALCTVSGFAPTIPESNGSALNVVDRKAFLGAAAAFVAAAPAIAMDQVLVTDPTEQWETGKPTPEAKAAREQRFKNARTQMDSNFPPIKRLKLERKSPVVSDSNAVVPDLTYAL